MPLAPTATPPPPEPVTTRPARVQATDLVVGHADFRLKIEDFCLEPGARVAVTGPSGVGKTTLLETLALLRRPVAGRLAVLGAEAGAVAGARARSVRAAGIGVAFADLALLPHLTVAQNVALPLGLGRPVRGGEPPGSAVAAVLAALGLQDLAGRRPAALSQGERQRVALARALVGRPPLVLADEPTAHLDAPTAARTLDALLDLLCPTAALVLVTHDGVGAARFATRWDLRRDA